MSTYSKLDEDELRAILKDYDIGDVHGFEILKGGSANSNYKIAAGKGDYVLTICDNKSNQETMILASLLEHLEVQGFNTTRVMKSKRGNYVSNYNDKPILLKSYLHGSVILRLSLDHLRKLGASLARLHEISCPDYLPKGMDYDIRQFDTLANLYGNPHPFIDWLLGMKEHISSYISDDLPNALVHGDVFDNNIVIDLQDFPVIMDFEEACCYHRIFDIGMTLVGTCIRNRKLLFEEAKSLVMGYESISKLSLIEKKALRAFAVYAAAGTALWRFRQFKIVVPTPEKYDHYKEMQDIADNLLGDPFFDLIEQQSSK